VLASVSVHSRHQRLSVRDHDRRLSCSTSDSATRRRFPTCTACRPPDRPPERAAGTNELQSRHRIPAPACRSAQRTFLARRSDVRMVAGHSRRFAPRRDSGSDHERAREGSAGEVEVRLSPTSAPSNISLVRSWLAQGIPAAVITLPTQERPGALRNGPAAFRRPRDNSSLTSDASILHYSSDHPALMFIRGSGVWRTASQRGNSGWSTANRGDRAASEEPLVLSLPACSTLASRHLRRASR